jgi:hypothetical protein
VLDAPLTPEDFRTSSTQFSGEWLFGSYLMAGIGFSQMAIEHPELRDSLSALSRQCIERLLSAEVRAFDRDSWGGEDPIDSLGGANDHAAYLGYLNLFLGLHRLAFRDASYADLNDRITEALVSRLNASRIGLLESYPNEGENRGRPFPGNGVPSREREAPDSPLPKKAGTEPRAPSSSSPSGNSLRSITPLPFRIRVHSRFPPLNP